MPYPPEHKREVRQRILEGARRLFNKRGLADVTIDEVMAEAGLTHGGFYRYFDSKDELYAAAVQYFLCKEVPDPWQNRRGTPSGAVKSRARRVIDAYFSLDHFHERERCCPLVALPSDVSRSSAVVKAAYQEVLEKLIEIFAAETDEPEARQRALAVAALCVGGMVLARGVDSPALADDLRHAAYRHAVSTISNGAVESDNAT